MPACWRGHGDEQAGVPASELVMQGHPLHSFMPGRTQGLLKQHPHKEVNLRCCCSPMCHLCLKVPKFAWQGLLEAR